MRKVSCYATVEMKCGYGLVGFVSWILRFFAAGQGCECCDQVKVIKQSVSTRKEGGGEELEQNEISTSTGSDMKVKVKQVKRTMIPMRLVLLERVLKRFWRADRASSHRGRCSWLLEERRVSGVDKVGNEDKGCSPLSVREVAPMALLVG